MTAHTERLEFFQVPELRGKLGIFPSPRVYKEETVRRVTPRFARCFANRLNSKEDEALNVSKSQSLYTGRDIGIFPSPRAEEVWNFSTYQALHRGNFYIWTFCCTGTRKRSDPALVV